MKRPSLRRLILASAAVAVFAAASCGDQTSAPSYLIQGVRVIAVTAESPYVAPGDTVRLHLTYADERDVPDSPEDVEVTWIGGCIDPPSGDPEACYPSLAPALSSLAAGKPAAGIASRGIAPASKSGVPNSMAFDLAIPEGALDGVKPQGGAPAQAIAYVFFAVCAGQAHPIKIGQEGGFPLECIARDGTALGGDSFVVGYTEVRVFADGRQNRNPRITGLTLDGDALSDDPDKATTIPRCDASAAQSRAQGCDGGPLQPCKTYLLAAAVADVAEDDTESSIPGLRETVWANHFTDAGTLQTTTQLISDPTKGYQKKHAATFTPPAEAGLVTLWAVVHDNRGGASVARGFVRVE